MILKKASLKDSHKLKKICVDAYSLNFHNHWNEGGLAWYLYKEFSLTRLQLDLSDKDASYYFMEHNLETVGFNKTKNTSPANLKIENSIEFEKIYILPDFKGMGICKFALTEIIKRAKEQKKIKNKVSSYL